MSWRDFFSASEDEVEALAHPAKTPHRAIVRNCAGIARKRQIAKNPIQTLSFSNSAYSAYSAGTGHSGLKPAAPSRRVTAARNPRKTTFSPTTGNATDWHAYYDERAAIAEYDGGLSRPEAEARAFECCVVRWLDHHHKRTDPTRCAYCGRPDSSDPDGMLLSFGWEIGGHAWLHGACWPAWHAARRAEAKAALAGMGIVEPAGVGGRHSDRTSLHETNARSTNAPSGSTDEWSPRVGKMLSSYQTQLSPEPSSSLRHSVSRTIFLP